MAKDSYIYLSLEKHFDGKWQAEIGKFVNNTCIADHFDKFKLKRDAIRWLIFGVQNALNGGKIEKKKGKTIWTTKGSCS